MERKTDHLLELFSKQRAQEIKNVAINSAQLAPSKNGVLDNENSSNVNNTSIAHPVLRI